MRVLLVYRKEICFPLCLVPDKSSRNLKGNGPQKLPMFKSTGKEKSTKLLISWQDLENQFLSFLFIDSFLVDKKPEVDCCSKAFYF